MALHQSGWLDYPGKSLKHIEKHCAMLEQPSSPSYEENKNCQNVTESQNSIEPSLFLILNKSDVMSFFDNQIAYIGENSARIYCLSALIPK